MDKCCINEESSNHLLKLCGMLELSVRINHKNGSIHLYEDLGEYECIEQAILWLEQRKGEEEEEDGS